MIRDPQAITLNETIEQTHPAVVKLLSNRGQSIFFPKKGILAQSADAASCAINATIGTALENDGSVMHLASLAESCTLPPKDMFPYAKGMGKPEIRPKWKEMMVAKNPALAGKAISQPVVTNALTHGLFMAGYLFVNDGDRIILPHLYWGNYNLIYKPAFGAIPDTYSTFVNNNAFNVEGLREKLMSGTPGKRIVCLNFPNNPTGFTPTTAEAHAIRDTLIEAAEAGNDIVVLIDDAYFGLVFEDGVFTESMFSLLCDAHERLLAVKLDGPTKEDYVWGFRVGFMTFGIKNGTDTLYRALEAKLAGAIRGSISNVSHIGQSLLLRAFSNEQYQAQKQEKYQVLKERYATIRTILDTHTEYREIFEPLPFNSGYFMCVRLQGVDSERLRIKLIEEYSTGVIVFNDIVRIAFSSAPLSSLETLFENIYKAGKEL